MIKRHKTQPASECPVTAQLMAGRARCGGAGSDEGSESGAGHGVGRAEALRRGTVHGMQAIKHGWSSANLTGNHGPR